MRSMNSDARTCLSIVLAAGEGMRMRSSRPKVLHEIAGRTMLAHVLTAVREAGAGDVAVVVGPGRDDVAAEAMKAAPEASVFVQSERRGTAHAVVAASDAIARGYDAILVTYADIPLLRGSTLAAMREGLAQGAGLVALGFAPADRTGYGRLIECYGRLIAIREAVKPHNVQSEYYLTDLVEIADVRGLVACPLEADEAEVMGVNDRVQL